LPGRGIRPEGLADGGAFTKALTAAWKGGKGPATWKELHEAACASITGQLPQINTYGPEAAKLLSARPFSPLSDSPALPAGTTRGGGTEKQALQEALESGESLRP